MPRLPTTRASAPSASLSSTSTGLPLTRRFRTWAAPDSPRTWSTWSARPRSAMVLSIVGSTAGADQPYAQGSSQAATATTSPPISPAYRTAHRSAACDEGEPSTPTTTCGAESLFPIGFARSALIDVYAERHGDDSPFSRSRQVHPVDPASGGSAAAGNQRPAGRRWRRSGRAGVKTFGARALDRSVPAAAGRRAQDGACTDPPSSWCAVGPALPDVVVEPVGQGSIRPARMA